MHVPSTRSSAWNRTNRNTPQTTPPGAFVEQVKHALENLYDFFYLQRHPLVLNEAAAPQHELAGPPLRAELTTAIDALSPGADVPFRAPHARLYNLLHFRYVERLPLQEIADDLGISLRQVHRDLRRAEESVAAILWSRHAVAAAAPEPRALALSSVQAEVARLDTQLHPVNMYALIQQAQEAVERLAQQRGVVFANALGQAQSLITTDPVVAQQVLVSLFSHAVQHAAPGMIGVELAAAHGKATLALRYRQRETDGVAAISAVATQLAEHLGWSTKHELLAEQQAMITVQLHAQGATVLVIDDNAGLIELIDRYLTGHAYRVVAATSGQEGLRLAQEIMPDAIILDVMMPETDGWKVLQRLRAAPQTAELPIVICSVFDDPELAYSLGASLFLPKPVSRDGVLQALRQLNAAG